MSQTSVGKTLAPYNAESKINVRLIARGNEGATQGISRKRQIWRGLCPLRVGMRFGPATDKSEKTKREAIPESRHSFIFSTRVTKRRLAAA